MLQTVGIVAIASILGASRWLHISRLPWFRAERSQKSCRMRCTRADFHVIRLQQRATLRVPIVLKLQDNLLKGKHLAFQAIAKVRILLVFHCCRQYNFCGKGNIST